MDENEGTIATDAPEENGQSEDSSNKAVNERLRNLDDIADRLDRQSGIIVDEDNGKDEEGADPDNTPESLRERDEKGRFKVAEDAAKDEPKYKVKIEGEEAELPLSEILKGYQKDQTASRRLQEAAELRKQLEAERVAIQEERSRIQSSAAQNEAKPPSSDPEAAKKLYQSLFLGTEEEGTAALSELLAGRTSQQTAIPVEQVANQAAARAKAELQYEIAEKAFKTKHEFSKDPELYRMTLEAVRRTAPESSSYEEAFDKAADLTINWINERAASLGFAKKETAVPQKAPQETRKQSLDTVRSASARVPKPPEEKEETIQDILNEMRKKRGLPV